jgi:hypothetical protein
MPILILLLVASLKVAFPDTPAGLMARQWVEAFPSEERMRAFLAGNLDENALRERTLDERMSSYRQSRKKFRSLELVSIVSSKPHELKVSSPRRKGSSTNTSSPSGRSRRTGWSPSGAWSTDGTGAGCFPVTEMVPTSRARRTLRAGAPGYSNSW